MTSGLKSARRSSVRGEEQGGEREGGSARDRNNRNDRHNGLTNERTNERELAHVAQLAEHVLGKDEVSGSIPLVSSSYPGSEEFRPIESFNRLAAKDRCPGDGLSV